MHRGDDVAGDAQSCRCRSDDVDDAPHGPSLEHLVVPLAYQDGQEKSCPSRLPQGPEP